MSVNGGIMYDPQLSFVQCDRGVYTYRTDNLTITLGIKGPVLNLSLKPQRGNPCTWLGN